MLVNMSVVVYIVIMLDVNKTTNIAFRYNSTQIFTGYDVYTGTFMLNYLQHVTDECPKKSILSS